MVEKKSVCNAVEDVAAWVEEVLVLVFFK